MKKNIIKLSIFLVTVFLAVFIQQAFYKPTKVNSFIASKVYEAPVNSAFTDENFYMCVVDAYNSKNNTSVAYTESLTDEQLETIAVLKCSGSNKSEDNKIKNVSGIEKLTSLIELDLSGNSLNNIDLNNNKNLKYLFLYNNQLESLEVGKNINLKRIEVDLNKLSSLDISNNVNLEILTVNNNYLSTIDTSKNESLHYLSLENNQLTSLDISALANLMFLDVRNNELMEIDVSNNCKLSVLSIRENRLKAIDVSNNEFLTTLNINKNQLESLDISKNIKLTNLDIRVNPLTKIDLSSNVNLKTLYINNPITEIDVSNNLSLTDLHIINSMITYLDVSNNISLTDLHIYSNQLRSLNTKGLTDLKYLYVQKNQLIELDVSDNISLIQLRINDNPFLKKIILYKGNDINLLNYDFIKLPSNKMSSLNKFSFKDDNIIVSGNNISFFKAGIYEVNAKYNHNIDTIVEDYDYDGKFLIYIVEATSDKYEINAEEGYIYTKTDTDIETILSNINLNYGEASIEDNKLLIKYENELVKSFDIVNVSSDVYKITDDYIYYENGDMLSSNIKTTNATITTVDDSQHNTKMSIKYNDKEIDRLDYVTYWSNDYDLTKGYIFDDEIFNIDLIKTKNLTKEIVDNKLIIRYGNEVFKTIDIVKIESEKYYISKDFIYIGIYNFDLSDINVINGIGKFDNNVLNITYDGEIIKEYLIYNLDLGQLNVIGQRIIIEEDISYAEFINNITLSDGLIYKIFNGEDDITEGNVSVGMNLKVYKEDELLYTYEITDEYLDMSLLNVDEEKELIKDLVLGTKVNEFKDKISTSGVVTVVDKDDIELTSDDLITSGSNVKIELSSEIYEYTLSVKGDITGTGTSTVSDVAKLYQYLKKKIDMEDCYKEAGNVVDSDNEIKINDVAKLYQFIKKKIESLED